jgi:probable rRNA maturation factor
LSLDLSDVPDGLRRPVAATLAAVGVTDGHLSVEIVGAEAMRSLNAEHRGIDSETDVLAFPIDGVAAVVGPRELGDVVICPEQAADVPEVAVHGVLHLCGLDHETDDGAMLELQDRIMASLHAAPGERAG